MRKVAGLVLAAGASTRMGRAKQLLPAGGLTLLDISLREALRSHLDIITLVLGFQAKDIKAGLQSDLTHPKLRIALNDRFREGISSSIVAGLSEVEHDCDDVMIILADMPHLTSNLIDHLLQKYLESRLPLGAIRIKNRRSHPVIINRKFYQDLHQLHGDMGARVLFLKYPDQVYFVDPAAPYDDKDIDTMEDYLEFRESFEHKPKKKELLIPSSHR